MICLRFHPKETNFPVLIQDQESNDTPVYITEQKYDIGGVTMDMSSYSFYYHNNYAIGCGHSLFPKNSLLGYHEHDIEHVSIYSQHGKPITVYFSAHGRGQGMWRDWDMCEKDSSGRLVVYVALNSHACYPEPKKYWRVFGLANDDCSNKGRELKSPNVLHKSYNWCSSNGVKLYASPRPNHVLTSITDWQRFCLPFYF